MDFNILEIDPAGEKQSCEICLIARGAAGMNPHGGPRATVTIITHNQASTEEHLSCPYHIERTITCLLAGNTPSPTVMPKTPRSQRR